MPRKFMFTREEIVAAALQLVRERGAGAVTARALGQRLGCSAKPIFGLFESMEQVQQAVLAAANAQYQQNLQQSMAAGKYPPYKASGMAYIQFAREEKELFKLLFMRDRSGEQIHENKEELRPLLQLLQSKLSLTEQEAYLFHLQMWVYVHGIATMIATNYLNWDDAFVSRALSLAYRGMIDSMKEEVAEQDAGH